jgi:pimeloyl-ACP methyl ester carboxylesterase
MSPPVLLTHGCSSSWQDWQSSWVGVATPQATGNTPGGASWTLLEASPGARPARARVFLLDYSTANTQIPDLSWAVAGATAEIRARVDASEVVLIGHSMGGLLARAYVQSLAQTGQYQNDAAALYMLASPNNGARVAAMVGSLIASLGCPQSWSVNPVSGVIRTLNGRALPPGIHCATITGMACRSRWFGYHDGILFADDTLLTAVPANGFVGSLSDMMQHSVWGNRWCSGHPGVIPASVDPIERLYDSQFP